MPKPFKTLLALALWATLTATATSAYAQQAWTLDDCVQYAMTHNTQIQQSQHTVQSAEADVKASRAALFPSLTFSTQQQWGFQNVKSQSYTTLDATPKNPTYTGSYGLQAQMTLYNGGANWRTLQQSRLTQQQSQLQAQMTANSIEVQIIRTYYQILYAHESVLTNEEIVAVAQRELDRTRARLEVGKGTRMDLAQMESQLQQNQYQLITARNTEASDILDLMQLLQLNPDTEFSIDFQAFSQDDVMAVIPTVAEAGQLALDHLPDMKAAALGVRTAELQTQIARGAYLPTVSLNASLTTSNGNTYTGNLAEQVENHLHESVGVSLSLPILDGRRTRTMVDKARIQQANAVLDHENTRLQVLNTIAALHLDIQSAQSRYQSALASEASALESFELMEERYNVGLETVIDLLTEKNNYLRARQETLQAKYTALLDLQLMHFYTHY